MHGKVRQSVYSTQSCTAFDPNDVGIMKNSMIVEFNDTDYTWTNATTSNNPTDTPLIDSTVFGWDKTNQTYYSAVSLEPGEAYWLYSYQSCTLK